jgi:tryptophan-rich sensory protein
VDIVIVRTTIIRCVLVALLDNKWVTVAQVTYFVWVSIATAIQLSIKAMS